MTVWTCDFCRYFGRLDRWRGLCFMSKGVPQDTIPAVNRACVLFVNRFDTDPETHKGTPHAELSQPPATHVAPKSPIARRAEDPPRNN